MQTLSDFKHRQNSESINQALKFLYHEKIITDHDIQGISERERVRNEAASPDLSQRFDTVVGGLQKATVESYNEAKSKAVMATKNAALKIDRNAHRSPWIYVGIASALSGIAGFFVGQKLKT